MAVLITTISGLMGAIAAAICTFGGVQGRPPAVVAPKASASAHPGNGLLVSAQGRRVNGGFRGRGFRTEAFRGVGLVMRIVEGELPGGVGRGVQSVGTQGNAAHPGTLQSEGFVHRNHGVRRI